jgi:hypothetical protein
MLKENDKLVARFPWANKKVMAGWISSFQQAATTPSTWHLFIWARKLMEFIEKPFYVSSGA